jgi:hypothetical protein
MASIGQGEISFFETGIRTPLFAQYASGLTDKLVSTSV